MKRLLITMYRLFFYERIVFWLFAITIVFLAGALVVPPSAAVVIRSAIPVLMASFALFAVISQLGSILRNRHLTMLPYGRLFVLGATFGLVILLIAVVSWGLMSVPPRVWGSSPPDFVMFYLVAFCASSLMALLACRVIGPRIFIPLILVGIIFRDLIQPMWDQVSDLDAPVSYLILVLISLSCWVWLALRPPGAVGAARSVAYSLQFGDPHALTSYIGSRIAGQIRLNAVNTLLYGSPSGRYSRIWALVVYYLVALLVCVVYLRVFVDPEFWGEVLLLFQFVVIPGIPFAVANWTAKLRVLWLRVPGDRAQFWHMWKTFSHTELLLFISILSIHGLVVKLTYDVSDVSIALHAVTLFLLLPSLCHTAAWYQLRSAINSRLAISIGVVYLSTLVVLIISTYAMRSYLPIICLASLAVTVGSLAYFRTRNAFSTLDWLQVRPIGLIQA